MHSTRSSNRCFNGLTTVNVELTSRCNKSCWMCGRRKVDAEYRGQLDNRMILNMMENIEFRLSVCAFIRTGVVTDGGT